ncbi:MAG: TNT domain-containing protein [Cyclobacteriaceae bacterium]|nr:TNT domain-containing protein [Cyclobacteriaceae bacterium]MCX7637310.1 TNT domain-containing protein [Cyclobacteriaceae bacterium]MDW8331111.1 glycohydrolase toxin TNT-related protein [Cyclobacteriaceae bacterium]
MAPQGSEVFFYRPLYNQAPSNDRNYVRTETVLIAGITNEQQLAHLSTTQKTTVYNYIDGLGRALQNVTVEGSPSFNDVVQPFAYDQHGRQVKEYLPYTTGFDVKGKFRRGALTDSEQSNFYAEPPGGVAATTFAAFKENIFEASPLNRVIDVISPRDDYWNATARKATTLTKINTANEVPLWKDFIAGLPERNGFHAPNTLMVQETTDEEGKITKVYTNPRGQTVMSRVGNGTEWFDTHYIYSPAGLLMFVIQPEGVARLATEFEGASAVDKQSFLDRWAFQYQYDDEQRQVAKRLPGYAEGSEGWFYTVFDRWNRVVLTQDPEQRTRNEYTFTKYDRFNRPIITGLYVTSIPLSTLRTTAEASTTRFETEVNNSIGYSLTATFPTSGISESNLLTVLYYDNYAFLNYTGWDAENNDYNFVSVGGYPESTELLTSVKGQATGSKIRVLGQSKWLNTVTYYDTKYRPVQVITENHLGGILRTTTQFDFVGNVLKEQLYNVHANLTIQNRYTYDHAGRQLTVHHQVNTQSEVLMASNKYNELGQLIEKNIHSTDNGSTFLQSIDYRYNIKGWLTHINNTSFTQNWTNDDTNDLFGMELQYYVQSPASVGSAGDVMTQKSLYDGNISAIKWKTDIKQGTPEERIYVFDYDLLSRLKKAHYARNTQTWFNPAWTGDSGMFDEIIHGYDKNGNIQVTDPSGNPQIALTRFGKVQDTKSTIDQLTYGYRLNNKHSNRLIDINDAGNSSLGFKPASASITEEYIYDRNGNLKFDHNKSISSVLYNHLNLVKEVQFTRPGGQLDKIEYTYDATGNKLSQLVRINGTQVWKTDYVGGLQYDNGTLSFIITQEGRVVKNNTMFDYQYFHKDHQGNVRMVYGPLKETLTYRATMENPGGSSTLAQQEEASFKNIATTRHTNPAFNYTPSSDAVVVPDKSARCNGFSGSSPVGPAKMLAVSAGDKVYMETYAKYNQVTGSNSVITAAALLAAFTTPFGIVNAGETATLYQSFNSNLPGISAGMGSSTTVPKAYLVWLFFNSSYQFVNAGGQAITTSAYNAFEKLSRSFTATQNGYLYIYVANESNASAAASVYFDDTYIVHEKNNTTLQVLQASDYYPFGLSFNQYQTDRLKETSPGNFEPELRNRYLFQGQELQKDLDLGWYQFKWRMHDPAIGRFGAVDPLSEKYLYNGTYVFSENKLIRHVELEGLESWAVGLTSYFGAVKAVTEYEKEDPSFSDYVKTALRGLWSGSQLGSGLNNIVTGTTREAYSKVDFALNGGEQIQQTIEAGEDPQQVINMHRQEQFDGRMQTYTGMVQVTEFSVSLQASLFTAGLSSTTTAFSLSTGNYGLSLRPGLNLAVKGESTALTKFYPANNGFLGATERTFLMPGEQISRYGSGAGKFFSPAGTPLPMRALPPGANTNIFNTYKVLKPFEVQAGKIAPAFGQPGLGTQYLSPVSVDVLLKRGIIGH